MNFHIFVTNSAEPHLNVHPEMLVELNTEFLKMVNYQTAFVIMHGPYDYKKKIFNLKKTDSKCFKTIDQMK